MVWNMRTEKVEALRCFLAAFWLLVVPFRWISAVILGTAIHECMHLLVLRLLGCKVYEIKFTLSGIYICTAPMKPVQEIICAAAGPAGSLLLMLFVRRFPELALCGFIQGLYNLLPAYPSDGGRILRCLCRGLHPARVCMIETAARRICEFLIMIAALACFLIFPRWFPVILPGTVWVLLRLEGKIPCIDAAFQV